MATAPHFLRIAAIAAATACIQAHAYQIAAPGSIVEGKSIAEWNAEWWTWAWNTPTDQNPLADTTGAWANVDNDGAVFFVAGANGNGSYQRSFEVPAGKPLLIPLVNYWENCVGDPAVSCGADYLPDPKVKMAERVDFFRASVTSLQLSIDGQAVPDLYNRWERSAFFSGGTGKAGTSLATFYESFGLPFVGLDIAPSLAYGYYAMVTDLAPGLHTIVFGGSETGYNSSFTVTASIQVLAVPEPSTVATLLGGLCALSLRLRGRREERCP